MFNNITCRISISIAMPQSERAFQKQPTVFQNRKRLPGVKKGAVKRYTTNVGLGFKTPREAREGHYVDKKCPFTGKVSIRGRILTGVITKLKMNRTAVIRRDYLHYVKKYNRFEKRHKNMSVHLSPCFRDTCRRRGHCRGVQTPQQDRQVQHPEGHQGPG